MFNFHPIHVFLDTEELRRYEQARPNYQNLLELIKLRNQDGNGTRDRLKRLLGLSRRKLQAATCCKNFKIQSIVPLC